MMKGRFKSFGVSVDGYAYVLGGMNPNMQHVNSTYPFCKTGERFNFWTRRWESLPNMHEQRCNAACCSLDGKIYVFGGIRNTFDGEISGEVYIPGEHPDFASNFDYIQPRGSDISDNNCGYAGEVPPAAYAVGASPSFVSLQASSPASCSPYGSEVEFNVRSASPPLGPSSFAMHSPRSSIGSVGSPRSLELVPATGSWQKVPRCRLREWFYDGDDEIDALISRVVILGAWPYLGRVYVMICVGEQCTQFSLVMAYDPKTETWHRTKVDTFPSFIGKKFENQFTNTMVVFPANTH